MLKGRRLNKLFFSLLFIISTSSYADVDVRYTDQERKIIVAKIFNSVNQKFIQSDPVLEGCWNSARKGNDTSLYAIYLVAEAYPIIVGYQKGMSKAVKQGRTDAQKYEIVKDTVLSLDPAKALEILGKLPGALNHCAGVSNYDLSEQKSYLSEKSKRKLGF